MDSAILARIAAFSGEKEDTETHRDNSSQDRLDTKADVDVANDEEESSKNDDGGEELDCVNVIVFSKDRPFQLRECLRSLLIQHSNQKHIIMRVHVIAKVEGEICERRYKVVETMFRGDDRVRFVWETDFASQLKEIVSSIKAKYVMFTVDDAFFYRNLHLLDCARLLRDETNVYCVHLKLHPGVTFCHPAQRDVKIPTPSSSFGKGQDKPRMGLLWTFRREEGTMDWNYPWDLACSLYRHTDVLRMLRVIEKQYGERGISHPNRLEACGHRCTVQSDTREELGLDEMPLCAAMAVPCMSVLTVNCVQNVFKNPTYDVPSGTLERMNALIPTATTGSSSFDMSTSKPSLDENAYRELKPRSVHIGDLIFKSTAAEKESSSATGPVVSTTVRRVIFDPLGLRNKEVTLRGDVSIVDSALGRMDVVDDGAKLICKIDASMLNAACVRVSSRVEVTGFVRKERRRTFFNVTRCTVVYAAPPMKKTIASRSTPLVSVILPVRNGEAFLSEALTSVLDQTLKAFELIAIDDGSTDKTATILKTFADKDSRIRILTTKPRGIVAALNCGLREARGDLIARMDADDVCVPERLEWQCKYLMDHPEVSVLGGAVRMFSDGEGGGNSRVVRHPSNAALVHFGMYFYCSLIHPTVMIRTSALRRHGGYSNAFPHAEDYDLWLRMLADDTIRMSNLTNIVLRLRKHSRNVSKLRSKTQSESALAASVRAIRDRVGSVVPVEASHVRALRNVARGIVGTEAEALAACELLVALRDSFVSSTNDGAPQPAKGKYRSDEVGVVMEDARSRLGMFSALLTQKHPGSAAMRRVMKCWLSSKKPA